MRFLDNLRFTAKSALPLILMAVLLWVSRASVSCATRRSRCNMKRYRPRRSWLATADPDEPIRAGDAVFDLSLGPDCIVLEQMTQFAGRHRTSSTRPITFAVKNIDEAKTVDSSRAAEYEAFKTRFLAMVAAAKPALASAIAGDMPRALAAIAPVADQMIPLRNDVRVFSANTLDEADRRAAKLAQTSRELRLTMTLVGAAAITIGLPRLGGSPL